MIRSRDGQGPLDDAPALSRRRATLLAVAGLTMLPSISFSQHDIKTWRRSSSMPPLKGTDLNGREWNLADLKGQSVLLNFWATWCAPCKEEMPTLQTLHELGEADLVLLTVNVRESIPHVQRYARSTGLTLPILPDPKGVIAKAWGIVVYPSTLLIDTTGTPCQFVTGAVDWSGSEALGWLRALRQPAR